MKSVDEHLADVLEHVEPLPAFAQHLLDAHGHHLAQDVHSPRDLPLFDNSAMDGYAVRLQEVESAGEDKPVVLPISQELPAGAAGWAELEPGTCARIMTGAPVPPGADAIVPVEWTDGAAEGEVSITRAPEPGQHIRRRGDDIRAGQMLLTAGTLLGPRQLGLLAGAGIELAVVHPRPRVVVISTGSELVEPGTEPGPGQIPDANSFVLSSAARAAGATVYRVGVVPDDGALLLETIEDQLIRADLVITSGGVSVGAYDVVKEVMSGLGTVTFDQVAMQPGKPQGFGVIGEDRIPIFTLPGNPVSAYVSFELFVRPVLRRLMGYQNLHRETAELICMETFDSPAGRAQYIRGKIDPPEHGRSYTVSPVGGHGSHLLGGLAQADCLICVPADKTRVSAGDTLTVILLEQPEGRVER
ncbi:MAG TPA: gephyrin-like molybdotransferase Glp [Actinocrinis sp.]|nr:gephyrin-like molybdotransferase Glp [Actinocrinis sp.]